MWCPSCKADVAAEVAADNRRVRCATCGADITAPSAAAFAKTREARDLLERWAVQRKSETPMPRSKGTEMPEVNRPSIGGVSLEAERRSSALRSEHLEPAAGGKSSFRLDTPHAVPDPAAAARGRAAAPTVSRFGEADAAPPRHESPRRHRTHGANSGSPHFHVQENLFENTRRRINWTAVLGQLIAYVGAGLLAIGSTLVLWSYFGGPANYAPTGWLATTAGQMLLFLGMVTLVSGGLEQAREEVKTRFERLGERIIRIEQFSRETSLRGPLGPTEGYGTSSAFPIESGHRTHDAA